MAEEGAGRWLRHNLLIYHCPLLFFFLFFCKVIVTVVQSALLFPPPLPFLWAVMGTALITCCQSHYQIWNKSPNLLGSHQKIVRSATLDRNNFLLRFFFCLPMFQFLILVFPFVSKFRPSALCSTFARCTRSVTFLQTVLRPSTLPRRCLLVMQPRLLTSDYLLFLKQR